MQRRRLGRTDLEVPVICFGAYAIGGGYWGDTDDDDARAAIRAALDAGMNAFDTAPVYGFGHSERVLGEALAGRRDEAVVMTKVGVRWEDLRGADDFEMLDATGNKRKVERNSRPESVRVEADQSLERLGVDRIDLIQVHARDPRTPVAETMGALAELRAEGKVRAIGVSNYSVADLAEAKRALGDVPLASDQPQYSLLARQIERDVLPWARANDVGLLVYAPLEQGLLTGKFGVERRFAEGEGRAGKATFSAENRKRVNTVLQTEVAPIARRHDATLAQVVLAWTVAQPGVTAALVGARNAEQAGENASAGSLELDPSDRNAIERAFAKVKLSRPARWRGLLGRLFARSR